MGLRLGFSTRRFALRDRGIGDSVKRTKKISNAREERLRCFIRANDKTEGDTSIVHVKDIISL